MNQKKDRGNFLFSGDTLEKVLCNEADILIPETCRAVGEYAAADNLYAERVTVPPSVRYIDKGAFLGCENLHTLHLSEGLEIIGPHAFANTAIRQLELPQSLRSIGEGAFEGCPLEAVVLPLGLREVEQSAFGGCWALRSVTIPDSLADLDEDAFLDCPNLRRIQASEDWQDRYPGMCAVFSYQLRKNFLEAAGRFCRERNIVLTTELRKMLSSLGDLGCLTALPEEMEFLTARLRQLDRTKPRTRILRNVIRCCLCGEEIESRSPHDYVSCSCGACAVDGGTDYLRRMGNPEDYVELSWEEPLQEEEIL